MKVCSCCGSEKPLELFQVRKASKYGRTASCKTCLSARDKERDSAEIADARRAYQHGKGRSKAMEAKRRYIERNPKKRAAHIAVGNAIRDGKLSKQPCEICGECDVVAHHDNYKLKLSVRWLCDHHHKAHHSEHGEGLNA
jgi:hypothetical protein